MDSLGKSWGLVSKHGLKSVETEYMDEVYASDCATGAGEFRLPEPKATYPRTTALMQR